jgi:hypothetical protein
VRVWGEALNWLFTGRGTSGSWKIRGEQLGHELGATVIPNALDVGGYEAAVLVKRPAAGLVERLHRADVPIVYDVVDGWPQPAGNNWAKPECATWLAEQVRTIRPVAIVAATQAMAEDCGRFGVPVLWLPHHARPEQALNKVRREVRTVGYEGAEHYLGRWRAVLELECAARGWMFHVKPERLADLDIVVALREANGYAPRRWKSNVKLANAQATGTPFIGSREAGYLETASGAERWADTEADLIAALDELTPHDARLAASQTLRTKTLTLAEVATRYGEWLSCRLNSSSRTTSATVSS